MLLSFSKFSSLGQLNFKRALILVNTKWTWNIFMHTFLNDKIFKPFGLKKITDNTD